MVMLPRNITSPIDPSGNFLYVGHQNTDNIAAFKVDKTTGSLEFTGQQMLSPGQPVCIVFQTAPSTGNSMKPGVTFWATNNPATAGANGAAQLNLAWNAPGTTELDIRIGAPDGTTMGTQPRYGTTSTGQWVTDGMMFYLQDISGGKPLSAENTLGTIRATVRS